MTSSVKSTLLDQRLAEQLAQIFNSVLTTVTMYGATHPNTQKYSQEMIAQLVPIHKELSVIALVKNGNSLYIENFCVDKRINVRRIFSVFTKLGIESIAFCKGVDDREISTFFDVFTKSHQFTSFSALSQELQKQKCDHIKLNFVFLQKMTQNDVVVDKSSVSNEAMSVLPATKKNAPTAEVYTSIKTLQNLCSLLRQHDVIDRKNNQNQEESAGTVRLSENDDAESPGTEVDQEQVLKSINSLAVQVRQHVAAQRQMGKVLENEQEILKEVDALSLNAMIKVIKQEYSSGTKSIKRLSHFIKKLVPDVRDLKRLLPILKKELMSAGLDIEQFGNLAQELGNELQNDTWLQVLEQQAQNMGMSTEDVLAAMNENPAEAAKLIVLAAEIKHRSKDQDVFLGEIVSGYVDQLCTTMSSHQASGSDVNTLESLEASFVQKQDALLTALSTKCLSPDTLEKIKIHLDQAKKNVLEKNAHDWISKVIEKTQQAKVTDLAVELSSIITHQEQYDSVYAMMSSLLRDSGRSPTEIQQILNEVSDTFEKKRSKTYEMPKYVLSKNNTLFFLQRSIEENLRYKNPFSCIVIGIEDSVQQPSTNQTSVQDVITACCTVIKSILRNLDLIGTLNEQKPISAILILPMTTAQGAQRVLSRFESAFKNYCITHGFTLTGVCITVSIIPFNKELTSDMKSYLSLLNSRQAPNLLFK